MRESEVSLWRKRRYAELPVERQNPGVTGKPRPANESVRAETQKKRRAKQGIREGKRKSNDSEKDVRQSELIIVPKVK